MIETGKPFKMKPKTRKAEKAMHLASNISGFGLDDLEWEVVCKSHKEDGKVLVAVIGDNLLRASQWVQTQDDPDWEIVK